MFKLEVIGVKNMKYTKFLIFTVPLILAACSPKGKTTSTSTLSQSSSGGLTSISTISRTSQEGTSTTTATTIHPSSSSSHSPSSSSSSSAPIPVIDDSREIMELDSAYRNMEMVRNGTVEHTMNIDNAGISELIETTAVFDFQELYQRSKFNGTSLAHAIVCEDDQNNLCYYEMMNNQDYETKIVDFYYASSWVYENYYFDLGTPLKAMKYYRNFQDTSVYLLNLMLNESQMGKISKSETIVETRKEYDDRGALNILLKAHANQAWLSSHNYNGLPLTALNIEVRFEVYSNYITEYSSSSTMTVFYNDQEMSMSSRESLSYSVNLNQEVKNEVLGVYNSITHAKVSEYSDTKIKYYINGEQFTFDGIKDYHDQNLSLDSINYHVFDSEYSIKKHLEHISEDYQIVYMLNGMPYEKGQLPDVMACSNVFDILISPLDDNKAFIFNRYEYLDYSSGITTTHQDYFDIVPQSNSYQFITLFDGVNYNFGTFLGDSDVQLNIETPTFDITTARSFMFTHQYKNNRIDKTHFMEAIDFLNIDNFTVRLGVNFAQTNTSAQYCLDGEWETYFVDNLFYEINYHHVTDHENILYLYHSYRN